MKKHRQDEEARKKQRENDRKRYIERNRKREKEEAEEIRIKKFIRQVEDEKRRYQRHY